MIQHLFLLFFENMKGPWKVDFYYIPIGYYYKCPNIWLGPDRTINLFLQCPFMVNRRAQFASTANIMDIFEVVVLISILNYHFTWMLLLKFCIRLSLDSKWPNHPRSENCLLEASLFLQKAQPQPEKDSPDFSWK